MLKPEILTAATIALAGLALAFWLAANRVPTTPGFPAAPEEAAVRTLAMPAARDLPAMTARPDMPDFRSGPNGMPCGPSLRAQPAGPGHFRVALDAPCLTGETIVIDHGPLRFAERLAPRGTLRAEVPRLFGETAVTARLGTMRLDADVPDSSGALPVVSGLVWAAPLALTLSAREYGAEPAGPVTGGDAAGGGRVVVLGDPAIGPVTDLYIGPAAAGPGVVRLQVEARRTEAVCDTEQSLVAFRSGPAGLTVRDIRLRLGDCEGMPPAVQLKNLMDDLKIAAR